MPTDADYAAGTAAALDVEHQIIQEKGIPSFMVPSDADLTAYAARVSKAVIDAVDTERAPAKTEAPPQES